LSNFQRSFFDTLNIENTLRNFLSKNLKSQQSPLTSFRINKKEINDINKNIVIQYYTHTHTYIFIINIIFYFQYIKAYLWLHVIVCDKDHKLFILSCFHPLHWCEIFLMLEWYLLYMCLLKISKHALIFVALYLSITWW
jgi:hypothetical protein